MRHKKLHSFNINPAQAIKIQEKLRVKAILRDDFKQISSIAGADVSYRKKGNKVCAAVVVMSFPELEVIEKACKTSAVRFPYVPGLLAFREIPVLLKAFKNIKSNPDLILVDGQGIAHPRRMGIASHLGVLLDKPTIGCAKTILFGKCQNPASKRGSYSHLRDKEGKVIGAALRTQNNVRPVYVSQGHKVSLKTALKVVLRCCLRYRIPEPLRLAHTVSKLCIGSRK